MKNVIIPNLNEEVEIFFDKSNPYIKIFSLDNPNQLELQIKYILKRNGDSLSSSTIRIESENKVSINYDFEVPIQDFEKLFVEVKSTSEVESELVLNYNDINIIDISNPFNEFDKHISIPINEKIIFSAPFGQGKTTFLNEFFRQKEEDYNIFRVFPINYSVANNTDVFSYIKVDILFQLLSFKEEIEFEKLSISLIEAAGLSLQEGISNFFEFSFKTLISIGKSVKEVSAMMKPLEGAFDKIKEKKKGIEIDDKKELNQYLKSFYEKEGSIYEDNLFTQLIKLFLIQIKEKQNKKNVLIIEDLDRMDPDHIFRIFNVLSAHIDSFRNNSGLTSNKFGFDKIILVSDLNNIKSLYQHKYGLGVNFDGYINKFYSTSPYKFDNIEVQNFLLKKFIDSSEKISNNRYILSSIDIVLTSLVKTKMITTRDLIHLKSFDYYDIMNESRGQDYFDLLQFNKGLFTVVVNLLSKIETKESFLFKIKESKKIPYKPYHNSYNYFELCVFMIGSLAKRSKNDFNYKSEFVYKEEILLFNLDTTLEFGFVKIDSRDLFVLKEGKLVNHSQVFNHLDFWNLFEQVVSVYFDKKTSN